MALDKTENSLTRRALLAMAAAVTQVSGCAQAQASGPVPPYCAAAAGGGAAPPELLGAEQLAAMSAVLTKYRADTLTEADARAIRQALHGAGLQRGPALDRALAGAGFSSKRLETLAPCPSQAGAPVSTGAAGRTVPPRQ